MKATMKTVLCVAAAAAAIATTAQGVRMSNGRRRAAAQDAAAADARQQPLERVTVDQFPRLGRLATFEPPKVDAGSGIGKCWTKPRKWIVLEAKYTTYAKWTERLTFTWHVMLETKTATEKSRDDRAKMAPYSYLSQSVSYVNIPQGTHAASVCLPPSFLERYGEANAVGLVITNASGEELYVDCESKIRGIVSHPRNEAAYFWKNPDVMDAKTKNGEPFVERREGLKDRSETIWAMVNPNDYETVAK